MGVLATLVASAFQARAKEILFGAFEHAGIRVGYRLVSLGMLSQMAALGFASVSLNLFDKLTLAMGL